jgi:hypothetical protein
MDTQNLVALKRYFTTGTAEADAAILDAAFIPISDLDQILTPPHASPRLLLGKKGSGKSAFVRAMRSRFKKAHIPVLLLRPRDVQAVWPSEPASFGDLIRSAEYAILQAIAIHIGQELTGMLPEELNAFKKLAQEKGNASRDVVQSLLNILRPIGQSISKVDFEKIEAGLPLNGAKLRKTIEKYLETTPQILYLIIDDTDQIAPASQTSHSNRIWALLLASRYILEECPHIRVIITLRTEVWRRMSRDDAGQRDQVDHFRDLIYALNPDDAHIRNIVRRRLELARNDLNLDPTSQNVFKPFFEGGSVKIPTTRDDTRSWDDFVVKRARERPRDAIQLISALLNTAIRSSRDIISNADVDAAILTYSDERVTDLESEVEEECPQLREIIRSFAHLHYDESGFKLKATHLLQHLEGVPSRFGVTLFGKALRPEDNEVAAFQLWKYLHQIGFINPKVSDSSQDRGFRHILVQDDESLVQKERWNQIQTLMWEVHPAYRDFLISVKNDRELSRQAAHVEENVKIRSGRMKRRPRPR